MPFPSWGMRFLTDYPDQFESIGIKWRFRYFGFGIGDEVDQTGVLRAPYWSIVIPLTLLSAWLLLSKPRIAKSPEKPT